MKRRQPKMYGSEEEENMIRRIEDFLVDEGYLNVISTGNWIEVYHEGKHFSITVEDLT